ncbi:MAG: hypothetical protein P8R43_06265 [Planctomycetota bacterium]|nr:hypothetical protein [Planctomycetota bacterium]
MQSAIRTLTIVAVLVGGGAACQTTPTLKGSGVETTSIGDLATINPVDVAVLPVEVAPGVVEAPLAMIRASSARALVRRKYSPLGMDVVDEKIAMATPQGSQGGGVQEASYAPGALGEDALLEVTVERWDMPDWTALRSIDAALTARLIDPRDPTGPALWEARLDRQFRFSLEGGTASSTNRDLRRACDDILKTLISTLPGRALELEFEEERTAN